ncbi:MAG: DNA polymerase Y family protein, partial [Chloroflexi bacterium]|nr:DNA polymerase Y family protein [Chloroflexota bacterium]
GIRTLGDFAALPLGSVQAQFGPAGRAAWELASGIDRDPLRPVQPIPRVSERLAFDFPTASLGTLTVGVQRLLAQAFRRPLLRDRVVRQVSLALVCEGAQSVTHRLALQEATAHQPRILLAIQNYLERTELPAAVEELRLTLEGLTGERGRQGTLFVDRGRLQAQIDEAARRLTAHFGRSPLFTVTEVEPWSRLPERRMALVEYSP